MNIVITGGSGYLGQTLAKYYSSTGHHTIVVSRRHPGDTLWHNVEWDGKTIGPWVAVLEGADAVINLAGRSVNCRYNEANKTEIYASRLDSTRVLGEAIAACDRPPRVWLNS